MKHLIDLTVGDNVTEASVYLNGPDEIVIDFKNEAGESLCGYTIDLDDVKIEVKKIRNELEFCKQELIEAHLQNMELTDELVITQAQYNAVVKQNQELQEELRRVQNG